MTATKIIGAAMIAAPFVAVLAYAAATDGILTAAAALGAAVGMASLIMVGTYLFYK